MVNELGFKGILIALLVAGLMALLLITGTIMISDQNDFAGSPTDDETLSEYSTQIEDTLIDSYNQTSASDSVLSNSTVSTTTSFPFIESVTGIWKNVKQAPVTVWNLTFGVLLEKMFGENKGIVLTVLGSILGLTLIFAIVYFVSTGEGR